MAISEEELKKGPETGFQNRDVSIEKAPEKSSQEDEKVEQKIVELESQLEEIRQLKDKESKAKLAEIRELQERQQVNEKYKELKADKKDLAIKGGTPAANLGKISATAILGMDSADAVASLVKLATENANGFETALGILRSIASKPGGAWILDQFHLSMTQKK